MKHLSFIFLSLILCKRETVPGGQFSWGGYLQKSNGDVQRLAYSGWKSECMCKRISQLDCEDDYPSRCESRC